MQSLRESPTLEFVSQALVTGKALHSPTEETEYYHGFLPFILAKSNLRTCSFCSHVNSLISTFSNCAFSLKNTEKINALGEKAYLSWILYV